MSELIMAKPLRFEHLVFDLDDTLLDTSRLLIPKAARESCQAMIDAGLNANVEQCLQERETHVRGQSKNGLFDHLAAVFGIRDDLKGKVTTAEVSKVGYQAFHNRRVERDIQLFEGAAEMLISLRQVYGLHLVTAGHRETQEAKIRILGLSKIFDSIHHVDPSQGQRKKHAFAQIMEETRAPASRHLSVGNRLDSDIGEARELGWNACWISYGEYANLRPSTVAEIPDYEIKNVCELVATCRL